MIASVKLSAFMRDSPRLMASFASCTGSAGVSVGGGVVVGGCELRGVRSAFIAGSLGERDAGGVLGDVPRATGGGVLVGLGARDAGGGVGVRGAPVGVVPGVGVCVRGTPVGVAPGVGVCVRGTPVGVGGRVAPGGGVGVRVGVAGRAGARPSGPPGSVEVRASAGVGIGVAVRGGGGSVTGAAGRAGARGSGGWSVVVRGAPSGGVDARVETRGVTSIIGGTAVDVRGTPLELGPIVGVAFSTDPGSVDVRAARGSNTSRAPVWVRE